MEGIHTLAIESFTTRVQTTDHQPVGSRGGLPPLDTCGHHRVVDKLTARQHSVWLDRRWRLLGDRKFARDRGEACNAKL